MQGMLPVDEPPLDPERPIVDPHQHFWDILPGVGGMQAPHRFLLPEVAETIAHSGHTIVATVAVECTAMYRADGPRELRCVGETEFCTGMAAMSASGGYGPARIGAAIVGGGDLRLGAAIEPVLEAHIAAAGGRFRGMRGHTAFCEPGMYGFPCDPRAGEAMRDPAFAEGVRALARFGLTLDVWCFHGQLPDLIALADAVPEAMIVLDHVGTPEIAGRYGSNAGEVRDTWLASIRALAERPNMRIKLGGLGMDPAHTIGSVRAMLPSEHLAAAWAPWIEPCIEAFGADRAMFESNFPPDEMSGSYGATWNAFKRIAAGCSEAEKSALFCDTATKVYRI